MKSLKILKNAIEKGFFTVAVMEQCQIKGNKDTCQHSNQFSGMDIKCLNSRCNLHQCTKVELDVEGLMDTMNNKPFQVILVSTYLLTKLLLLIFIKFLMNKSCF